MTKNAPTLSKRILEAAKAAQADETAKAADRVFRKVVEKHAKGSWIVAMTDNDDEYRRQASDAQKQADRANNDLDRSAWLRIAQGWLAMVKRPRPTPEQSFDQETRDRQTGPSSDKSN